MIEIEHVLPADIEKTSFRIIEKELREQGREIPEDKKHVILRAIHTTADFEYLDTLAFSQGVLENTMVQYVHITKGNAHASDSSFHHIAQAVPYGMCCSDPAVS